MTFTNVKVYVVVTELCTNISWNYVGSIENVSFYI